MAKCEVCKTECSGDIVANGKPVCSPSHVQHILDLAEEKRKLEEQKKQLELEKEKREEALKAEAEQSRKNDEAAKLEAEKKKKKK